MSRDIIAMSSGDDSFNELDHGYSRTPGARITRGIAIVILLYDVGSLATRSFQLDNGTKFSNLLFLIYLSFFSSGTISLLERHTPSALAYSAHMMSSRDPHHIGPSSFGKVYMPCRLA